MGIRPNKSIGWGITVKGSDLVEKSVDKILNKKSLSYAGLFEYLEKFDFMNKHRKHGFLKKDNFIKLDKDKTLYNYVDIIPEEYDSEDDFVDQNWTIIFYPMVLSPLAFHEDFGIKEFKENSSPFVYAEIERFFPESMENVTTVSYNVEAPPFPSEYSVIFNKKKKSADNFKNLDDKSIVPDVKRCLLAKPDDQFLDINAQVAGFDSVKKLKKTYCLAPAEEIFSFAQYSNIFNNESFPYDLKPMVIYYWT